MRRIDYCPHGVHPYVACRACGEGGPSVPATGSVSDTPRTDAARTFRPDEDNVTSWVESSIAESLERELNKSEKSAEKWRGMYAEAHAINSNLRVELAKANRSIERCVKQAFDAESRLETCRAELAALSLNAPLCHADPKP